VVWRKSVAQNRSQGGSIEFCKLAGPTHDFILCQHGQLVNANCRGRHGGTRFAARRLVKLDPDASECRVRSTPSRILRVTWRWDRAMKQNITLAIEQRLLKRARSFAAQQGTSVSAMLASELRRIVETHEEYAQAKSRALAQLDSPFQLGGRGILNREDLHDRHDLR
jgi:hypothetical protein